MLNMVLSEKFFLLIPITTCFHLQTDKLNVEVELQIKIL